MQSLFEKLIRLSNSAPNSHSFSSHFNQILFSICQHLKKHSEQIQSLHYTIQDSKTDTLTLLGGKISLSQFPTLIQKYKLLSNSNSSSLETQKLKAQINEIQIKLQSYHEFQNLFDRGTLKEYEMRSLEDMILGNQQYIKGNINQLIVGKADRVELQRLYALNDRFDIELTNLSKGLIELSRQPVLSQPKAKSKNFNELDEKLKKIQQNYQKQNQILNDNLQQLQNQFKHFTSKISSCETTLNNIQTTFLHQLDSKNSKIQQKFTQSISTTFQEQRQSIEQNIQQKIMISLYGSQSDQNNQIHNIKVEIIELTDQIMQLKNKQQIISNDQILQIIDSHFKQVSHESTFRHSSDINMIKQQIIRMGRRLENEEKHNKQIMKSISVLKKQLQSKVSISDIEKIVQKLSTIDETKHLITESLVQFQQTGFPIMQNFIEDQTIINETLCSENMLGRWFWDGKELRNGNLIPWEKQIINTSPENFYWEQGTYQIIVMREGVYKIQLGVYGEEKKKPSIQLIVNGNAVMSAVNNSSYVIHHSSGRLKDTTNGGGNKFGNGVVGVSLIDFLMIQGKSRIAVSFVGDTGRGFISLKKL